MTDQTVEAARDYPQMAAETDRIEPAPRRVRATLAGRTILDTTRARYVWEFPSYPQYYIPIEDVDARFLVDEGQEKRLKRGTARWHGLRVGGEERPGSVRVFGADAVDGVAGTARFDWDALDAWYEEDEQVFGHLRDPYHRVDVHESSRPVTVRANGRVIAHTERPKLLFETGLQTRVYVPRADVAAGALTRAEKRTVCPYKGEASYWSLAGIPDAAWSYESPLAEATKIQGHVSFDAKGVEVELGPPGADVPTSP
jgi:uncharacterized protein (DUF427 family)